jgi:diaminopimelate decarboxylase
MYKFVEGNMNITIEKIEEISREYGESFYLLDSKQFERNFFELQKSFRDIYPNSYIAYSYKTNYIPKLCKLIDKFGGFAEVVSDMECQIALKIGVNPENIYFNGPYKRSAAVESLLLEGGVVNLDSVYELDVIKDIANRYPNNQLSVGLRCNFEIYDGVTSRFGFDVESEEFINAVNLIRSYNNINLVGLHCHFATRSIETWPGRVEGMLTLVQKYFKDDTLDFISLGGGLYGKMGESLKAQFDVEIPSYQDYANAVATKFRDYYKHFETTKKPKLIIEPGSALVGDAMKFAAKVINIKDVRGKKIATLAGSIYNINPTLNKKNPPINVYHNDNKENIQQCFVDLDFGGYTCIESDYLYRGFNGNLSVGDYVVFDNVGSYSVVLKPPFILPNFAIVDYDSELNSIELIKHKESFEDVFKTFEF